jgi:hypothetical protein
MALADLILSPLRSGFIECGIPPFFRQILCPDKVVGVGMGIVVPFTKALALHQ